MVENICSALWKLFVSLWGESFLFRQILYQYIPYIPVTAGPFFSHKRCIVQLQSFPLIEELAKRPLTCGSLPHCAPGRGEQPHHLGGESCAENGLILYGLWCLIPTGSGQYSKKKKKCIKKPPLKPIQERARAPKLSQ